MRLTSRGKLALALVLGAAVCISCLPPDGLDDKGPTSGSQTVTVDGCTYYSDGSGQCGQKAVPPLQEYDPDFCNDVDPDGEVIALCHASDEPCITVYEDGSGEDSDGTEWDPGTFPFPETTDGSVETC